MVTVDGLLEPEAGQTLLAALEPLARPHSAADTRSGGQRRADALTELARRALEAGQLPQTGGVRPQLSVLVDLDSLLDHPGAIGGEAGAVGPLAPEACRRLACDGAVTRVLVSRKPSGRHAPTTTCAGTTGWPSGCRQPWPGCRRSWAAPPVSPGCGPDQPGRHPRPTQRPRGPGRRLCLPRLPAAPFLV